MNISKKLIAVLAIFCLIASAGVVCAEDVSGEGDVGSDGGYSGSGNHTNATNATTNHGLLSTGNPILILLVVIAIVGAVIVIKRK